MALAAALVMAPIAPEAGNIVFLVAGGVGLLFLRRHDFAALARPIIWMPLAGLAILAGTYAVGTSSIEGIGGVLVFAPLLAVWPLVALSGHGETPTQRLLATLSLVGVAGAVAIALNDYLLTGSTRAGGSVANPIHFADIALAAGYLSLVGVAFVKTPSRYVFLLGPVLAAIAVTLSGTRGAIVALVVMAAVAIACAGFLRLISMRTFVVTGICGLVALAVALFAGLDQTSGVQRVMLDIADVLNTGLPTDASTAIRLSMYQGGLDAFLSAPLFGHGPFAFVDAAAATQEAPLFVGAPHLHSDLFDFAASGGIMGLLSYFLFLLAPLVEALRAPFSATRNGLVVVTATLTAGYFVMGLTNAMFGILTLTIYFVAICVVIGILSQDGRHKTDTPD
ncbi:MAG: O-antigen ligase family protein [Devosia sp.]